MSLAPLADRVLVLTVPGNHDEARRDRVTTPGDSWAIEAVAGAADALELWAGTTTSPSSTPSPMTCR
jgi:hypothetical protein